MQHRPVALLDACVLVPMPLADTLLRLAEPPTVFDTRWSEDILGEMSRALVRRFAKTPANARYREAAYLVNLTAVVGPSPFLKTLWKLDRSAIEVRLRERTEAIGLGVEELLGRLAQSVPAFVEVLRSRD